jgi:hypothetical protein
VQQPSSKSELLARARQAARMSLGRAAFVRDARVLPIGVPVALGVAEVVDEPPLVEDEEPLFAPAPMRLSNQPAGSKIDTGAARAAVVMAHIVAARLKSGVPITSDDPDLASLLDQVRALDESGIGEKE